VPERKDGKESTGPEGYYTALPLRDELRCFIAALYGRGFSNGKSILHGNRNASDVAVRCAYYGKGELTAKDIEAGIEKDGAVFTFAATLNERIHKRRDLRKLMEDEYLHDDDMIRRWLKYDEQIRRKWPNSIPTASVELAVGSTDKPTDTVQSSIVELQMALATLTTRVSELRQLFITGAIILAALLIYFHWF
jgi:hypothetical protein